MSRQSCSRQGGKCVVTGPVYVLIELARIGRIFIATEAFWVATSWPRQKVMSPMTELGVRRPCARDSVHD